MKAGSGLLREDRPQGWRINPYCYTVFSRTSQNKDFAHPICTRISLRSYIEMKRFESIAWLI